MQAIPAFLTIAVMPLTYSIAYGVVAGLAAYIIINGTNWLLDNVTTGAKSLPQWVAHVRQVCIIVLLPASRILSQSTHQRQLAAEHSGDLHQAAAAVSCRESAS